jgi:transglutaminase-like putative cysteine protease
LSVLVGTTATYRAGVIADDELDPDPQLEVDSSAVNLNQLGEYPLTYTATNRGGLSSSVTVTVRVVDANTHELHSMADERLELLGVFNTEDLAERARLIHNYVRSNMSYDNNASSPDDEIRFAYNSLRTMRGNCIASQRVSETLLNRAGIETHRINNDYATASVRHSWNLIRINGQWYHFDATNFMSGYVAHTYMFTQSQALDLNRTRSNVYTFNAAGFPPIAN